MSNRRCGCFFCCWETWVIPLMVAFVTILVIVTMGGGRHPAYVDFSVYIATGSMVYLGRKCPAAKAPICTRRQRGKGNG